MIERPNYLDVLISFKDKKLIKIATGIRRCGKSTLFELYQNYLLKNGIMPNQIQNINLEDADYRQLLNWENLHDHISKNLLSAQMNYIFLDEIQNVADFQKAADSLFIKKNVDLYLTGSNARMLSGEIATLLSGRYIEIQMLPLSFKEYLSAFSDKSNLPEKFKNYLSNSGFPYTLEFKGNRKEINRYLGGIYNTVLLKDIASRKKIPDISRLESVIHFMFSNIGNETSINNIRNTMKSSGKIIEGKTIENYLDCLIDSFVLYRANRFDIKGKQYLKTNEKYYLVDIGLRYFLLGRENIDEGHILENIVYLELLRRGYKVYIGKVGAAEVDFAAVKDGQTQYYQVAQTVMSAETLKRELSPLNSIRDHNQKYLLTQDYTVPTTHNGIEQINVLDWLIED